MLLLSPFFHSEVIIQNEFFLGSMLETMNTPIDYDFGTGILDIKFLTEYLHSDMYT